MRTIYAIRLQVTQQKDQTVDGSYADLIERACIWVREKYQRAWRTSVSVRTDGETLIPLEGHSIRGLSRSVDDSELFTLDWAHPADDDPSTQWVMTCTVSRSGGVVQIALLIRISTTRIILRPVRFTLGRPKLITDILTDYRLSIDDWPVPITVEQLASPDVQTFVDKVLANTRRNIPVVMISPDVWSNVYSVNAQAVFDRVKGFAHVAVLKDKWAAFKLTDAVDKPLSCYAGTVRVYWPGFSLHDNPMQHKLYFPQSIIDHEQQGLPFQDHLFRMLAAIASFRYTEGNAIREVRQALLQEDRRKVDELRDQINSGSVEKDKLEIQLLEALEIIDQITKDRDDIRAALAAQQAAWAEVQQTVAAGESADSAGLAEEKPQFTSVVDSLQQARKDFSGPLLFLDSAFESAQDSPFKDPERVYEMLEALWLVADIWKKNGGTLGKSWNDAMQEFGFDLRDQVSKTSKSKWADDYKFQYKGEKRLFEKHITIGAKQADTCLSVHWYRDDDDLVLAIGHCGRHPTNKKS